MGEIIADVKIMPRMTCNTAYIHSNTHSSYTILIRNVSIIIVYVSLSLHFLDVWFFFCMLCFETHTTKATTFPLPNANAFPQTEPHEHILHISEQKLQAAAAFTHPLVSPMVNLERLMVNDV